MAPDSTDDRKTHDILPGPPENATAKGREPMTIHRTTLALRRDRAGRASPRHLGGRQGSIQFRDKDGLLIKLGP